MSMGLNPKSEVLLAACEWRDQSIFSNISPDNAASQHNVSWKLDRETIRATGIQDIKDVGYTRSMEWQFELRGFKLWISHICDHEYENIPSTTLLVCLGAEWNSFGEEWDLSWRKSILDSCQETVSDKFQQEDSWLVWDRARLQDHRLWDKRKRNLRRNWGADLSGKF